MNHFSARTETIAPLPLVYRGSGGLFANGGVALGSQHHDRVPDCGECF